MLGHYISEVMPALDYNIRNAPQNLNPAWEYKVVQSSEWTRVHFWVLGLRFQVLDSGLRLALCHIEPFKRPSFLRSADMFRSVDVTWAIPTCSCKRGFSSSELLATQRLTGKELKSVFELGCRGEGCAPWFTYGCWACFRDEIPAS